MPEGTEHPATAAGLIRHLVSIAVLPFLVAVLIPAWLARRHGIGLAAGATTLQFLGQAAGLILLALGLGWFTAALRRIATEGQGTLAPWDPPRRLVVQGIYGYVRNPMISGVVCVLLGEALVLLSRPHLQWALLFLLLNVLLIPLFEEPQLARRFGEPYREYCRHVPRFIPRLHPWQPDAPGPGRAA